MHSGEVTGSFCDGCKCVAFSDIFFHSLALDNSEIKDKVGTDALLEGLELPRYQSLDGVRIRSRL